MSNSDAKQQRDKLFALHRQQSLQAIMCQDKAQNRSEMRVLAPKVAQRILTRAEVSFRALENSDLPVQPDKRSTRDFLKHVRLHGLKLPGQR